MTSYLPILFFSSKSIHFPLDILLILNQHKIGRKPTVNNAVGLTLAAKM